MRSIGLLTLFFFFSNAAFSLTEIQGVIHKGEVVILSEISDNPYSFPKPHYDIRSLLITRASLPITLSSGIRIDKEKYRIIESIGSLDLITYNAKTGNFKYRLTAKTKKILDISTAPNNGKPIDIATSVLFYVNHLSEIIIEGRVNFVNNKPELTNLNSHQTNISISYDAPQRKHVALTMLGDIPILINTA